MTSMRACGTRSDDPGYSRRRCSARRRCGVRQALTLTNMADHLPLPGPTDPRPRRRTGFDPDAPPLVPNRERHATTLAGRLEGLGLPHPGRGGGSEDPAQDDHEEQDSRIVLVFTARAALTTGPFRGWKMIPLVETASKGMLVLSAADSQRMFARLVGEFGGDEADWDKPKAWDEQLSSIDDVRLYDRTDRTDERLLHLDPSAFPMVVDVTIWPSSLERPTSRQRVVRERLEELADLVAATDSGFGALRVVTKDPRPDTPMLRVTVDRALLDALLEHPLVEYVSPPESAPVVHADLAEVAPPATPPDAVGAPVGIIDDLVQTNPYLEGIIEAQASFPADHTWAPPTPHGTQVAGIAAYGGLRPITVDPAQLATPHPIYAARVLEADPADPARAVVAGIFHVELEHAIRWLHEQGVKVVTCSINSDIAATRAYPGEAAALIDSLARELDLVIIVSAGNLTAIDGGHWRDDYPEYLTRPSAAVAEPGTAAIAVTVGALAWYDKPGSRGAVNQVPIAREKHPSPFTRLGPTRGTTGTGTMKPEMAAHGGNWAWDNHMGLVKADPSMGVVTLLGPNPGHRLVGTAEGTSFAAPYVANQAAEIATRYPEASANLIRCLLALSSDNPHSSGLDPGLATRTAAYGVPRAGGALESGSHRVTLTFEGELPANTTVVHPIPVPSEFATGEFGQMLTLALAFDPEVRRTRRSYQGATMDVELVRNIPREEVVATYQQQPSEKELALDSTLTRRELPSGRQRPTLVPGARNIESNTLIRRRLTTRGWDPDDEGYYVVVRHDLQPWAKPIAGEPQPQRYALAVELRINASAQIDLYTLIRAELDLRARARM